MIHARKVAGLVGLLAVLAVVGARGQVPGWDPRWPPPEKMLQGHDPAQVQDFRQQSAAIARNPGDVAALNRRASVAMEFSRKGLYRSFWQWLAAKDLEQVVKLDPGNFVAWHNYGDLNYRSGDYWMTNDHSNAERAVMAFNHAIALNPRSARSYMGRGWAYQRMNDSAHANADFQTALQLDPSLRATLQSEVQIIEDGKRQEAAARGTLDQMGRYYVERAARTQQDCDRYRGLWTQNECHISMALYPGPRQPGEAAR
jgi:tetratricopeptide (TPR) repeat protein